MLCNRQNFSRVTHGSERILSDHTEQASISSEATECTCSWNVGLSSPRMVQMWMQPSSLWTQLSKVHKCTRGRADNPAADRYSLWLFRRSCQMWMSCRCANSALPRSLIYHEWFSVTGQFFGLAFDLQRWNQSYAGWTERKSEQRSNTIKLKKLVDKNGIIIRNNNLDSCSHLAWRTVLQFRWPAYCETYDLKCLVILLCTLPLSESARWREAQ